MRKRVRSKARRVRSSDHGISLVELAAILPIIALLLLAGVEATWAFAQQSAVNDSANEGARLAAANFGTPTQVGLQVCDVLDSEVSRTRPRVTLIPLSLEGQAGDVAEIEVQRGHHTLTGFLDGLFLGNGLTSTVEFELERPESGTAQWWNDGQPSTFVCPVDV